MSTTLETNLSRSLSVPAVLGGALSRLPPYTAPSWGDMDSSTPLSVFEHTAAVEAAPVAAVKAAPVAAVEPVQDAAVKVAPVAKKVVPKTPKLVKGDPDDVMRCCKNCNIDFIFKGTKVRHLNELLKIGKIKAVYLPVHCYPCGQERAAYFAGGGGGARDMPAPVKVSPAPVQDAPAPPAPEQMLAWQQQQWLAWQQQMLYGFGGGFRGPPVAVMSQADMAAAYQASQAYASGH